MNDLFRAIFGTPPKDQYEKSMDDTPPPNNDYRDNFMRNTGDDMGDDDDDDIRMNPPGGFFGFSMFNDPFAVHKHFERLVNEMNRAFGGFGFDDGPSITFEDPNRTPCNEGSCQRPENLRDLYLKQPEDDCNQNQKNCNKVSLRLNEPGTSSNLTSDVQVMHPRVISKFVYIQKVQKPDGSIEVIQKVRDHTGNEETTITQTNVNEPLNEPLLPPQDNQPKSEDSSGLSILRKFFSF